MYPTIPSDTVGVLLEDRGGKLLREMRQAQKERKILILRKKPKFDLQAALDKIGKVK